MITAAQYFFAAQKRYIEGGIKIETSGKATAELLMEEAEEGPAGQIPSQLLHPQAEPKGTVPVPAFDAELNFD